MDEELKQIEGLRLSQLYDQALSRITQYVAAHPNDPFGHNIHGILLRELGDPEGSIAAISIAVELGPGFRRNLGMSRLHLKQWQPGWADYEFRYTAGQRPEKWGIAPWDGLFPQGLRLLVWQDQGCGDVIQFARFIRVLADHQVNVTLKCGAVLRPLMDVSALGITRVIDGDPNPAEFDAQIPIMSLPHALTSYDPVPDGVAFPYFNDPGQFPSSLPVQEEGKRRIAIAWSCSAHSKDSAVRSCPLAAFAPLAVRDDLSLWSVQTPRNAADGQWLVDNEVLDLHGRLPNFRCTAVALRNVNALVTVDTAVAHLAGAMDIPTIVLLRMGADWRWHDLDDTESPWYPQSRLVRQTAANDWNDVLARANAVLNEAPFI